MTQMLWGPRVMEDCCNGSSMAFYGIRLNGSMDLGLMVVHCRSCRLGFRSSGLGRARDACHNFRPVCPKL